MRTLIIKKDVLPGETDLKGYAFTHIHLFMPRPITFSSHCEISGDQKVESQLTFRAGR